MNITVDYSAQNLPYYPKQIAFYGKTHNVYEINGSFKITGVVYFTLYNTVEVWNINDFHRQPRLWIMEKSPEPERVFIPKDSIPVSNILPDSLITEEWQRKYRLKKVSGLPYYIKMMPLHPDTVAAMKLRDSIESGTRVLGKGGWTWWERRFHGHVTGTITAGYTNDVNDQQTLNLKGIKVVAYDLDDWWNDELGSGYTDENGNYDIWYDSYQWEAHIELFVTISTLGNTNTGVYESDMNPCLWNNEYELSTDFTNVSNGTNIHTNFGVWNLPTPAREPFKILNWANRAQDFVNSQVGSIARERLNIFCYESGSNFSTFPCQRLYLEDEDVSHETVIWHEIGHYLMDNLSGSHSSAGGVHWFERESIFTMAWNEGWATRFMAMLDQFYRGTDNEYGFYAFVENPTRFLRIPTETRERTRLASGAASNGMKSEYHIATFLYDLYDGPGKFANNEPASSYDDSPNSTSTTWLDRTGFDNPLIDDLELTPAEIFSPLVFAKQNNFGVYSINQYYMLLSRLLNDCGLPKKIQKLLTQNGVIDWTPNQQTNTNQLSTDLIGIKNTMTEYYGPLGFFSVSDNYYNDINELSGTSQNFNLGLTVSTTDYQGITDILEVKNGAKLGINANMNIGFSSGPTSATNSTLYVNVCNQTLTINSSSTLEVGGTQRIGILTIKGGTNLILKTGSTLDIKDNSSIVLESGANLVLEKGVSIKLNGSNSIIIVKHGGKIQIGQDAVFNYLGDGFIKFETAYPYSAAIEAIGPNEQFKIIGGAFGSTSKKVIEITGGEALTDLTTFHSSGALYNLTLFSVQNGYIELSQGSRLIVSGTGTKADFRSVDFRAATPNTPSARHRGLIINGQQGNVLLRVSVSDAINGVQSNNVYGGANVDILQYSAIRCINGLYIWGAGARIQDAEINNCITAIRLEGMTRSTRLYRTKLYANTNGIYGINCINNVIELYQPNIYNNYYGLYGFNSQFAAFCGSIKNNASSLQTNGVFLGGNVYLTQKSNLILDPVMRVNTGRMDLSNSISVAIRQNMANIGPFINQSGSSLLTNSDFSIFGTIDAHRLIPAISLNAENNLWGFTNNVSRSPINLIDYDVKHMSYQNGLTQVIYNDNSPISQFTPCGAGSNGGSGGDDRMRGWIAGEVTPIRDLPNLSIPDGRMIKETVQEAYNLFFDIAPEHSLAVENLTMALNSNFTSEDLEAWSTAILLINSQLIEALGEGIEEGNISVFNADSITYSNLVSGVIELQDKLLNDFVNDNQNIFVISIAKASLLRMLNDRIASIQVLNGISSNLYPDLNSVKESMLCMTTKEKLLLEGSISLIDYDSLYNCSNFEDFSLLPPPYIEENPEQLVKQNDNKSIFANNPLNIYPNPTNGLFSIKFKGEEAANYQITILDIMGKVVDSYQGIFYRDNKLDIDLSSNPSGIYFIKMTAGNDSQVSKIILTK
ncbi:MAG: T9SS type A sorting domain-containing protein [Bacteroidia bacterium]